MTIWVIAITPKFGHSSPDDFNNNSFQWGGGWRGLRMSSAESSYRWGAAIDERSPLGKLRYLTRPNERKERLTGTLHIFRSCCWRKFFGGPYRARFLLPLLHRVWKVCSFVAVMFPEILIATVPPRSSMLNLSSTFLSQHLLIQSSILLHSSFPEERTREIIVDNLQKIIAPSSSRAPAMKYATTLKDLQD